MRNVVPDKKSIWPLTAGLACGLGCMWMLSDCSRVHVAADGHADGDTLDVAIEYAPGNLYRYCDTLGGFNYDLLRELARRHGLKLRFHPVSSVGKSLDDVALGTVDLLVSNIPHSAGLKDRFSVMSPIETDRLVLVQRKAPDGSVGVDNQLDLAGDTVWVAGGTDAMLRLANLGHEIGDTIYTVSSDEYGSEQLFLMVAGGEIKQAVVSGNVADELKDAYENVDVGTDVSFPRFQSWVTGKEKGALADSLNGWIARMKDDGALDSLRMKYGK